MGIELLKGETLVEVKILGEDEITFATVSGRKFRMWHQQDCCESVEIEDVAGDWQDLIGSPILVAEEARSDDPAFSNEWWTMVCLKGQNSSYEESNTWTFYKLATVKGSVDIRWHGSSNGYYSEEVSFAEIGKDEV